MREENSFLKREWNLHRILIYSHSPFAKTGYGVATKNMVKRLSADYEVEVYGIIPRHSQITMYFDEFAHHGLYNDYSGSSWLLDYCNKNIDVVITHLDTWLRQFDFLKKLDKRVRLLQYAIIDHSPVSPVLIKSLERADMVLALSEFGQNELLRANIPSYLLPLGVDLNVFKPAPKNYAKAVNSCEGKFVVLWNATNNYRKGVEELFKAWKMFSEDKIGVLLHIHTDFAYAHTANFESYNLKQMIKEYRIREGSIAITTERYDDEKMNLLYNSADVYLNTSYGEACCLPILEAYATKVPVVAPDSTAVSELIRDRGYAVKIAEKIPNYHIAKELLRFESFTDDNIKVIEPLLGYQFRPSASDIAEKLNEVYNNYEEAKKRAEKAYEFIKDRDWDKIIKRWKEILG
jgi:glycosyltransferase involved in cell wall biosynthesis